VLQCLSYVSIKKNILIISVRISVQEKEEHAVIPCNDLIYTTHIHLMKLLRPVIKQNPSHLLSCTTTFFLSCTVPKNALVLNSASRKIWHNLFQNHIINTLCRAVIKEGFFFLLPLPRPHTARTCIQGRRVNRSELFHMIRKKFDNLLYENGCICTRTFQQLLRQLVVHSVQLPKRHALSHLITEPYDFLANSY
jgi:hypothetical protein